MCYHSDSTNYVSGILGRYMAVKLSKLFPVWLVAPAIIFTIISAILKAQHKTIVETYSPSTAIESMKMAQSLGWATTTIYVIAIGLWIAVLFRLLSQINRRED